MLTSAHSTFGRPLGVVRLATATGGRFGVLDLERLDPGDDRFPVGGEVASLADLTHPFQASLQAVLVDRFEVPALHHHAVAILRKNHADEQYLARRNLKELPDKIAGYGRRIDSLTKDIATLAKHEDDPITVGNRAMPTSAAQDALGQRLERLPTSVIETCTVPLGEYRGLAFGVILHAMGGLEAYLDGAVMRRIDLRDNAGPRAVLNALERLAGGYGVEKERAEQDRAVAEGQLRDYESRLGGVFAHDAYQRQLADLRDKLKLGLSDRVPEQPEGTSVPELAEQIKALRASHAVEAVPQRAKPAARTEKPVSARIQVTKDETPPAEEPKALEPQAAEVIPLPEPVPQPVPQMPSFGQWCRNGRNGGSQLSLF